LFAADGAAGGPSGSKWSFDDLNSELATPTSFNRRAYGNHRGHAKRLTIAIKNEALPHGRAAHCNQWTSVKLLARLGAS